MSTRFVEGTRFVIGNIDVCGRYISLLAALLTGTLHSKNDIQSPVMLHKLSKKMARLSKFQDKFSH
jgi:hypothetical protein